MTPTERLSTQNGPLKLTLDGDHYTLGRQHGAQVKLLRPQIDAAITARLEEIAAYGHDARFEGLMRETRDALLTHCPDAVAMIWGQAESLGLDFERLLRYDLVSYLRDDLLTRGSGGSRGCTAWSATGSATIDEQPILTKSRDYQVDHLPLQTVSLVKPAGGHRYVCVGSAGSPGVYCAGINDAGLAVADTHVASTEIGAGLPDFATMMHMLEQLDTVAAAVDYLRYVPRLGRNNLILADATGEVAVFESGHRSYGLLSAEDGTLVTTNHRVCPSLRQYVVDLSPAVARGNSLHRYEKVSAALEAAHGQIDVGFAQRLMASHDGPMASICRHPVEGCDSATIAACIFLPTDRAMLLCHGLPCQGTYEHFRAREGGDERWT
ncbi:MAG: C45 family autoproteolytic acyltransferase/hydrolase [Anaerolineae bacterium]